MEYITSKQNYSLKHLRALRQKKYREEFNEFVLEGQRLVKDSLSTGIVKSIFVKESIWKGLPEIADWCNEVSYYVVADKAWEGVGLTEHDQGIVAIGAMPSISIKEFYNNPITKGIYLLVEAIQDPGNLGALIRTAVAVGVKALFLTKGSVDVYNPKVVRSAMSALHKIPIYTQVEEECIGYLLDNMHSYALDPIGAVPYASIDYESPTLLVVGNEGNGISKKLLFQVENSVRIPMEHEMESLNLTIAASIVLFKVKESL